MKVEKTTRVYTPFKDHFKKQQEEKKELQKKKKVVKSADKKDSHFIGWA
jgi:hypothetical protein